MYTMLVTSCTRDRWAQLQIVQPLLATKADLLTSRYSSQIHLPNFYFMSINLDTLYHHYFCLSIFTGRAIKSVIYYYFSLFLLILSKRNIFLGKNKLNQIEK